ncbi:MAG: Homoserine O-acetyltransferase [Formosa sp. Hel3_A1_48]|nr:MAG: Homoserine O-acetyltransferase [Formosa sp. Hel3_A1_48]
MNKIQYIEIPKYTTISGKTMPINLSYQLFGCDLHSAPVVLVNHALTGNSNVAGSEGWWSTLIGPNKAIDTNHFTVLAFNIPGNGFDGHTNHLIEDYKDFVARDVAKLFLSGLESLGINQLFAAIGGSLGGGIAWEMAALNPKITTHLIPVASDWKSTDWIIANCLIQEQFLVNSKRPIQDARMHAMLCYRTPESFQNRFHRSQNEEFDLFNIETWLLHHGDKLQKRFQLSAYKLMNQLLKTIDITTNRGSAAEVLQTIEAEIHIIGIDSDLFFVSEENTATLKLLHPKLSNVSYHEITSIHGHDAFLIEYEQLNAIIKEIFQPKLVGAVS